MDEIAWRPTEASVAATRIHRFMQKHGIATIQELRARSVHEPEWFWAAIMEDLEVLWDKSWTRVFDDSLGMSHTKWFEGGKINIVRNCVDRHVLLHGDKVAFYWESEDGQRRQMTYRELDRDVTRCATALREAGIGQGDVVGMVMPMCPEAVIIMYAAMKIGAVPMQPMASRGPGVITQLLIDAKAKIVFAADGYQYGGEQKDLRPTIHAIAGRLQIPVVVVQRLRLTHALPKPLGEYFWADFMLRAAHVEPVHTASLESEDPGLILFSSGTTGIPKGIIHVHGGMLVNTAKELGYAFDCQANDVFFWATNLGWMMAPWEIIGVHFFGGTCVLYEGSPLYPSSGRLFEMIERYRVTKLGLSPALIRALDKTLDYGAYDLSSLQMLGSTSAPIDETAWRWYFEVIGKGRLPIMNIIGGTEIMGCFLSPLPIEPQTPTTVGGPGLGMDVILADENGNELPFGSEGILICRRPFPSMTRGFLGGYERFIKAYFDPWPQMWNHHDRVRTDAEGRWYVSGRDDDVINRGGVKYDPVSIENALRASPGTPRVIDATAVGIPVETILGQKIVCFIKVDDPAHFTDETRKALRKYVGAVYDPAGKPEEIHVVRELPMTLSNKKPYKLYVRAYQGETIPDVASYSNGDVFADIAKLGTS